MRRIKQLRWVVAVAAALFLGSPAHAFPWVPPIWLDLTPYPDVTPSNGVRIAVVTPGGPADRAGLEPGDVILRINGERTRTVRDAGFALQQASGERATMLVFDRDTRRPEAGTISVGYGGWIGARVREVAGDWRGHAVQVTAVRPSGPAAAAGLEVGDAIKAVDGRRVQGPGGFAAALRAAGRVARITYVDAETGRTVRTAVRPEPGGRIGVNAVRIPLGKAGRYPY